MLSYTDLHFSTIICPFLSLFALFYPYWAILTVIWHYLAFLYLNWPYWPLFDISNHYLHFLPFLTLICPHWPLFDPYLYVLTLIALFYPYLPFLPFLTIICPFCTLIYPFWPLFALFTLICPFWPLFTLVDHYLPLLLLLALFNTYLNILIVTSLVICGYHCSVSIMTPKVPVWPFKVTWGQIEGHQWSHHIWVLIWMWCYLSPISMHSTCFLMVHAHYEGENGQFDLSRSSEVKFKVTTIKATYEFLYVRNTNKMCNSKRLASGTVNISPWLC